MGGTGGRGGARGGRGAGRGTAGARAAGMGARAASMGRGIGTARGFGSSSIGGGPGRRRHGLIGGMGPQNLAQVMKTQIKGGRHAHKEKGGWKSIKGITTFSKKMLKTAQEISARPGKRPGKEKWFFDQVMDKNPKFAKHMKKQQARMIPAGLFGKK